MTDLALTQADYQELAIRLGDNALIIGHRISEWCGHSPVLEEDIALANVSLDFIGQAQLWLGYAAELQGNDQTADTLAYLRDAHEFKSLLLAEQPNGDYAQTLIRQMLFDIWHVEMLTALSENRDKGPEALRLAEIAEKSLKEAHYHLERSRDLCIRMGDGTEESNQRCQKALSVLWKYVGEMFTADELDDKLVAAGLVPDMATLKSAWTAQLSEILAEANLTCPESDWALTGGKQGVHTENMGFILADMQFLQRAYPGATW